jgi:serine protease inhibitor
MKRKLTIIAMMCGFGLGCLFGLLLAKESLAQTGEDLALAQAKFGFKLFDQLRGEKEQNLFISPASISFALAMTYNGAAAETRQAMAKTLEVHGLSLEALNQGNARLRQALISPDPDVKLNLANSLWLNQGQAFKPEFLKNNEQFYGAALQVLNFRDPGAPAAINSWVAKETSGKITRIVEKIEPPLVLINAIYFKGPWNRPFNKALTKELPFTLDSGKQKQAPMMSQSGSYNYYQGKNFQVVNLPYGGKTRFGMKIFLPEKNLSLKEFFRELNAGNWRQWLASMQTTPGTITLPRFKLEYGASLKAPLKALGMEVAFNKAKADFSNLCPPPGVYIDDVIHKTFVEVNEEGTEAAAVTAVTMVATAARPPSPQKTFTMVVDRPFFVVIDDSATGTLLFMGAIVEPQ